MDTTQIVVYITTFAGVTSLSLVCFSYWARNDRQIRERISELSDRPPTSTPIRLRPSNVRQLRHNETASRRTRLALWLWPNDHDERHRLQTRLLNAGIYSPSALPLFLSVKLSLICLPPVIGATAGSFGWIDPHLGLLGGSLIGGLGLILPSMWLRGQKRKWHTIIARSLADFLDLMVACLEVGLSPEAALQRVTEELKVAHPRLSAELSVVQAQIELGASSDAALRNFAERSDCEAIRAVAVVVQQGRRLGGGLAEVFRQQADSLRTRREHLAEEKAQQAAVKIVIPTLLFIFPVIFVVLAGPAVIKVAVMFTPSSSSTMVK